ncbi:major facilitator superfamily domain-containing protein [Rhypophila decipiens]|uniref:Major facilitator superfamily domain-containing protein n=1 Tax=Rhypophila decipiens TaxID=261697 RepID=A0AAN7BA64_9PEZI|nr:major facilitator superfamily domain-containing protein [Rhypophila decipiens]
MEFQPQEAASLSKLPTGGDESSTKKASGPASNIDSPSLSSSPNASRTDFEGSDHMDDDELQDGVAPNVPRVSSSPDDVVTWEPLALVQTRTSIGSSASRPPEYEVVFEPGDPENPKNWPTWYRAWIIFSVSFSTWAVVVYSTTYTSIIPGLGDEFNVSAQISTLGVTTYLFGLAAGSVIVAPLSEIYGRRPVYIICLLAWAALVVPCGLATSIEEILVVRFFGAFFGAAMVSNSPGTIVDIMDHEYLSLGMSCWSIAPLNGPVTGPIIGGFVYQYMGWRWANWIVLIIGGAAILVIFTVKETYTPTILQRKAARKRKETDDERYWSQFDQRASTLEILKLNMGRPFVLAVTEPILIFFNIWISIIYAILYLCFVAYPIVFVQYRQWSPGFAGLGFLGIGIGTMIAICLEPLWRRIINSHEKDPETGHVFPEAIGSVMCIGSFLTPIGQLVFSWTSLPPIHWAIPIAFGIPFGLGNTLAFIYSGNYLAGCYEYYAASAMAGNAVIRSVLGGTLPLAGNAMYKALTPQWAGTLLGLCEVLLIPIPFIFYRYGDKIRAKSKIIRQMREERAKNAGKRARQLAREVRRMAREQALREGETETKVVQVSEGTVNTREVV